MRLSTHGNARLQAHESHLKTDYRPADSGIGLLALERHDEVTADVVYGSVRLDPWIADEYRLIEFATGNCFLICGAEAVVALDRSGLTWLSSVGLEAQECETLDAPWHVELAHVRQLVVATERRAWCIDERGGIRWMWSCSRAERDSWISGPPSVEQGSIVIPIKTARTDRTIALAITDGQPRPP
jgi:hypothetical protein